MSNTKQEDNGRDDRLYVDLGCSYTQLLTEGRFFDQQEWLIPSRSYSRFAFPPSDSKSYPEQALYTRYLHTCVNRVRHPVTCVKWSPEGRRLMTGSQNGEFTLWGSYGFVSDSSITGHDSAIRCMTWSHDQDWLVSGDHDGKIKIWTPQVRPVKVLDAHLGQTRGIAFSPTDAKFVSGGDDLKVKVWDMASGEEDFIFDKDEHTFDVRAVDWHAHKALIASGARDNMIKIWDPVSKQLVANIPGHKNTVNVVQFCTNNGNLLLSGSRDKTLRLYDLRRLKDSDDCFLFSMESHTTEIQDARWHPVHENVFVSGGYDGSLAFWSVNGAKVLPSMDAIVPSAHEGSIWCLDFHPTGHLLCTGSNDRTCKFWSRMLPGDHKQEEFYSGYTGKGSEFDLLRKAEALPIVSEEQSLYGSNSYKDHSDKMNRYFKRRRIEVLSKVFIPGVGDIGKNLADEQAGFVLQPVDTSLREGTVFMSDPSIAKTCDNMELFTKRKNAIEDINFHQLLSITAEENRSNGSHMMTQNDGGQNEEVLNPSDPSMLPGPRVTGFVRMYDESKGFGFIRPHDNSHPDMFAHSSDIEQGFGRKGEQLLGKNDLVVFRAERGENKVTGSEQYKAKNIVLLEFDKSKIDDIPEDPLQQYKIGVNESKNMRQHNSAPEPAIISSEVLQLLLQNQHDPNTLAKILQQYNIDINQLQAILEAAASSAN